MSTQLAADTILAADFGTASTRVSLFDVVEGVYRFIGHGEAPSTVGPPYQEASEGMRHALLELQAITGRAMLDDNARLVMPATADGRGVDTFVATASAGPAVRAVLLGLLPDVTLESARSTAATSYISVMDTFSLGDRRREDKQIDAVLAARPELIVIAGGTDGGASEALLKLVETVSLACHLLPPETKLKVLYVGNAALKDRIGELMGRVASVHSAPNVQPELGVEVLDPARAELGRIFEELRLEQIGGFLQLAQWAGGHILPTVQAEGHLLRFLSRLPEWPRGVLGVNVGSASTSMGAAFGGELFLSVRPDLGVGHHAAAVLADTPLNQMTRWIPFEVSDEAMRDFILNKSLYPHTVPTDVNDLYFEHALARQTIRSALRRARAEWPESAPRPRGDLLPWFSLILGSGAVVGRVPRPGLAALILLDALQPSGITRLVLDPFHLAAALGAIAHINPLAVAQIYSSLAFLDLGTAVSAVGWGRVGELACQAKLVTELGAESEVEVPFGSLEVIPLPLGQSGKLTLRPRAGFNLGFGQGRVRTIQIKGGAVGVIIDARGRPVAFPKAPDKRYETVQQWIWKVGGA